MRGDPRWRGQPCAVYRILHGNLDCCTEIASVASVERCAEYRFLHENLETRMRIPPAPRIEVSRRIDSIYRNIGRVIESTLRT
jgi:hypothetical protein